MKELLKAGVSTIIGTVIGLGIFKLLDVCIGFIYNHFGETGLYVSTFAGLIVLGTIINYVIHKYVFDKAESEGDNV